MGMHVWKKKDPDYFIRGSERRGRQAERGQGAWKWAAAQYGALAKTKREAHVHTYTVPPVDRERPSPKSFLMQLATTWLQLLPVACVPSLLGTLPQKHPRVGVSPKTAMSARTSHRIPATHAPTDLSHPRDKLSLDALLALALRIAPRQRSFMRVFASVHAFPGKRTQRAHLS